MRNKPRQQICVVTIGIDSFVLPMNDGLRMVDIMGKAAPVERNYQDGKKWRINHRNHDLTSVSLELVRAEDIENPPKLLALPGVSS